MKKDRFKPVVPMMSLDPLTAEYLGCGYSALNMANKFFELAYEAGGNDKPFTEAISQQIVNCSVLKAQLDANLACNKRFVRKFTKDDVLRQFEVLRLYNNLTDAARNSLEHLLKELNSGGKIYTELEIKQQEAA